MNSLFGDKRDPELQARDAIRRKKWSRAIAYYEQKLRENERDFALWNLLGDLHMSNRARARAAEAWRRALEGFALEGLHENVLGVARKILRRAPEEEDVHLILAEACLGLEYHADCLAALRAYLRLAKHRSEADLRSLFKRIPESGMRHPHLFEELRAIYKESAIEDIELERRLEEFVEAGLRTAAESRVAFPSAEEREPVETSADVAPAAAEPPTQDGLLILDGLDSFGDDNGGDYVYRGTSEPGRGESSARAGDADAAAAAEPGDIPAGEGKDHYDLGMVYKEMKLWDAAIAEFEQARRDSSLRARGTLALAECLQESHDLQGALALLESEQQSADSSPQDTLSMRHRLGIIHELLGNLDDALQHFEAVQNANPGYGDVETRISALRGRLTEGSPDA
jgi:tetratricopeptide (TPR) repeat protein